MRIAPVRRVECRSEPRPQAMDDHTGYLRFPSIHDDAIVFVSDDDLWRVAADGGIARRLTAGLSEPSTPCLSPDGRWIAFVGRDEQHPEVYLMAAEGGPARRLTWLGPDVIVRGWTPDGQHRVRLDVRPAVLPQLSRVHARSCGRHAVAAAARAGQSSRVRSRQGVRHRTQHRRSRALEALSRRHRGTLVDRRDGQRRVSPHDRARRQRHEPDVDRRSRLLPLRRRRRRQPVFVPPGRLRPHAPHRPRRLLRAPRADRRQAHRLSVRRASSGSSIPRRDSERTSRRAPAVASHAGRAQVRARRRLPRRRSTRIRRATASRSSRAASSFTFPLWEGAVRQHGDDAGGALSARPVARGRRQRWSRSATQPARSRSRSSSTAARACCPGTSAASSRCARRRAARRVAIANHRNEVLIGDLASGALTVVDRSEAGRTDDLALVARRRVARVFVLDRRRGTRAIKLHDVAGNDVDARHATGVPRLRARVRSGRPLSLLPVAAHVRSGLRQRAVRAQLPARRAAVPHRAAEGRQAAVRSGAQGTEAGLAADERKHATATERFAAIDLDGIARRIAAFPGRREPVRTDRRRRRRQGDLDRAADRRRARPRRAQGRPGSARGVRLRDAADRAADGQGRRFALAADHATLVVRQGKRLRAIAGEPQARRERDAEREVRRALAQERLDRSRPHPRCRSIRAANGSRCCARCGGCSATSSGCRTCPASTGSASTSTTRRCSIACATRAELSDLIWEMQGELGTSHAYEGGGDHRQAAAGRARLSRRGDEARRPTTEATRSRASCAAMPGMPAPIRRSMPSASRRRSASASSRSTASARRSRARRRRCSCIRPATKVELKLASGNGAAATTRDVLVDDARRRSAGALSRMGRAQSRVGARAQRRIASATCIFPT